MLERIGDEDIIVRNYTDNFNVKEYIQEVLVPKAFPNIPMNKLNLGFTGVVSEYISQGVEDSVATASLMMNESFITKAVLPESIYAEAALFGLGYTYAVPSTCSFALQLSLSDVVNYSTIVQGTNIMRYTLDKDTAIILGESIYKLDYDINIDHQFVDGKRVFNVYYNTDDTNSISNIASKYVKYQVSSIDWLVLFLDLQEYDRLSDEVAITDNVLTTNSDIEINWINQIAGIDLTYISPTGQELPMQLKPIHTKASSEPFAWYRFEDDTVLKLSFTSNSGYWAPEFNSTIRYTVYVTHGEDGNFTSYDRRTGIPVTAEGERYPYNEDTKMIALCYSGSTGGLNRGDIETLRDEVILAYNSANVLSTDADLKLWFDNYGKRYGSRSTFFKRRDDPSGRLWSQFIAIKDGTYTYPTNTLNIRVTSDQFDYVNSDATGMNEEFIIKPGHIWEYDDNESEITRNRLRMVTGTDGYAMISDDSIPSITESRPFMFVNPFFIKIHRNPTTMACYNYLISHTSWPEAIETTTNSVYQFQMAQFSIERSINNTNNNMYHIEAIVVPVVTDDITYVNGIGDEYPIEENNLRLVLICRTAKDGETGYIEMIPTELRNSGAVLFETDLAVYDNIRADGLIEIDLSRTPDITSLITADDKAGRVFIDAE